MDGPGWPPFQAVPGLPVIKTRFFLPHSWPGHQELNELF